MTQHDYSIANQTFPNTRTDINNALGAVATNNAGNDAPSTTYANQWWFDSDGNILYMRNKDNDAWVSILTIGATSDLQTITTDLISEVTSAAGVTIDGLLVKDGGLTATGAVELQGTTTGAQHKATWVATNNSLDFGDSTQLRMGASADLKIYHDGSNSYIVDSGTGNLKISAADLQIMNSASSELMIQGVENGAVTLYHNNIAKASTGATGLLINGTGATYGQLGVENAGDVQVDLFSNVGSGAVGKAEIFFSSDTGSDHLSMASIVMEQDGASSRKGQIKFNVSDNGGPATAVTIQNNKNVVLGAGIAIGGTGSANTLDDYEEGTFTPIFTSDASAGAYNIQDGDYTKVGDLVHICINLSISTIGSFAGAYIEIQGLPFASENVNTSGNILSTFINAAATDFDRSYFRIANNASTGRLEKSNGVTSTDNSANANHIDTGTTVCVTGTYKTV